MLKRKKYYEIKFKNNLLFKWVNMRLSNHPDILGGLKAFIHNLIIFTRIVEWVDKTWIILGAGLILLLQLPLNSEVFKSFVVFAIYTFFALSYGYAVNIYADREVDARAGKHKKHEAATYFSQNQLMLIFGFLIAGMLGIPFYFGGFWVEVLGVINLFLATFYSLKPIRFKERGFLAILVAGGPQRAFLFLFFALLVHSTSGLTLILFLWLTILGVLMEIGHQILDYRSDKEAGLSTWATRTGIEKAKKIGISLFLLLIFFLIMPAVLLPFYQGLAISLLLASFSSHSVLYFLESLKR